MKKGVSFHRLRRLLSGICLIDKCILLVFALLLAQSAVSLFVPATGSDTTSIDVIVRTSAASIFGYIISVNFNRCLRSDVFRDAAEAPTCDKRTNASRRARIQTILATAVCLFCLTVLIVLRNLSALGVAPGISFTASVAQFRDIVSASVGFLVGSPSDDEA